MERRTDLAVEARQIWEETAEKGVKLEGVSVFKRNYEGCPVTTVKIENERGAAALGKPTGTYVTIELKGFIRRESDSFGRSARVISAVLQQLLRLENGVPALVIGLGNRSITPDALGPEVADQILATRHLIEQVPDQFGSFRPVASLAVGVLGNTGVESGELVHAVSEHICPGCVIAVDALASRSVSRLCTTVQIADTGIVPGAGVNNARAALDRELLGVPVVAVGVPTVVDAATLACDLLEEKGQDVPDPETLRNGSGDMIVTTRDIDTRVSDMARVIACGINLALQTGLTVEDVQMLTC